MERPIDLSTINVDGKATLIEDAKQLPQVKLIVRDPQKPHTPDNVFIELNGKRLGLVQAVSYNVDALIGLPAVTLTLYAHLTIENECDQKKD